MDNTEHLLCDTEPRVTPPSTGRRREHRCNPTNQLIPAMLHTREANWPAPPSLRPRLDRQTRRPFPPTTVSKLRPNMRASQAHQTACRLFCIRTKEGPWRPRREGEEGGGGRKNTARVGPFLLLVAGGATPSQLHGGGKRAALRLTEAGPANELIKRPRADPVPDEGLGRSRAATTTSRENRRAASWLRMRISNSGNQAQHRGPPKQNKPGTYEW